MEPVVLGHTACPAPIVFTDRAVDMWTSASLLTESRTVRTIAKSISLGFGPLLEAIVNWILVTELARVFFTVILQVAIVTDLKLTLRANGFSSNLWGQFENSCASRPNAKFKIFLSYDSLIQVKRLIFFEN